MQPLYFLPLTSVWLSKPNIKDMNMTHQFQASIAVNAPKQSAWLLLADYGGVEKYAEGVLNSYLTTERDSGIGCTRHCELPKIMMMNQYIVEEIIDWIDGESFTYAVTDTNSPIKDGKVRWWVTGDDQQSKVNVDVSYQPKGVMGALMKPVLKRVFPRQIDRALHDIKSYLEQMS